MRFGRQRAALTRLEIHYVRALPGNVALRMMFEDLLSPFTQHLQRDAKTAVSRLCPGNRLEEKIHRRAAPHRFQLCGDMREAARLCRHAIGVGEPGESAQNSDN